MITARFREVVSTVLITGVMTSALLLVIAFAAAIAVGWNGSLLGAPVTTAAPTDFSAVIPSLIQLRPIGLAQAGLLVLLATPILRVATSVIGFALEGDRLYTVITVGVLAILLVSLFLVR